MHIYLIILTVLILLLIGYFLSKYIGYNSPEKFTSKPCDKKISNLDYLKHMIPHHQVAVDISLMLQRKSKNPTMQNILRKIIWIQKYEIDLMKEMLTKLPRKDMSDDKSPMNGNYSVTVADFIHPNKVGLTNTYCDPHFFDPEMHEKHLQHMKLDDIMYIKHMIPHHQVAVDMSKNLLKHTNNDFMIYLAYRIINSQQEEIVLLDDLLKDGNYRHQSGLIV